MGDYQHNLPGPRAAAMPERCQFCENIVAGLISTASTVSADAGTSHTMLHGYSTRSKAFLGVIGGPESHGTRMSVGL